MTFRELLGGVAVEPLSSRHGSGVREARLSVATPPSLYCLPCRSRSMSIALLGNYSGVGVRAAW